MTPKILLEQYREKLNVKKGDFADCLWISNSTISNILNERFYPSEQTIEYLSNIVPWFEEHKEEFLKELKKRRGWSSLWWRKKWIYIWVKYKKKIDRERKKTDIADSIAQTKELIRKTMPPCRPVKKIGENFFFEKEKKINTPMVNKSYEDYLLDDFKKWKMTRSQYEAGIKRFNLAQKGVYVDI